MSDCLVRKSAVVMTERDVSDGTTIAILEFLCGRFTYHSREQWLSELTAGRVLHNGRVAEADGCLRKGDTLEYRPAPRPEPSVNMNARVLSVSQDGSFAFLEKPANLPCHPAGAFFNHTLWAMLKTGQISGLAPKDDIHFVNRLDRETSGIVLVAFDAQRARMLTRSLRESNAVKEYRVLVHGNFADEALEARGMIYTRRNAAIQKMRFFTPEGHALPEDAVDPEVAHTSFRRLHVQNGLSLLSAVLHTGRTHQIRATLYALGYPVVGDKLYGKDPTMFLRFIDHAMTPADRTALLLENQALHAVRLTFSLNGVPYDVECPMPEAMKLCLQNL